MLRGGVLQSVLIWRQRYTRSGMAPGQTLPPMSDVKQRKLTAMYSRRCLEIYLQLLQQFWWIYAPFDKETILCSMFKARFCSQYSASVRTRKSRHQRAAGIKRTAQICVIDGNIGWGGLRAGLRGGIYGTEGARGRRIGGKCTLRGQWLVLCAKYEQMIGSRRRDW